MTSTWNIDPAHSTIHFSVRHMVISKVRGRFARFSGVVKLDDADPKGSSVEATIDASSIDTGVGQRDTHLRSADFFDAERFPELRFKSKRTERLDATHLRVTGDLTIRNVTREVALEVELGGRAKDPWGNQRVGFLARGSLDRRDFGLQWNQALETGGVLVGERVELELDIQGVQAAATEAA